MAGHVDANYRFIAAWQEVNTRIAQRQQALSLYVGLVLGLLAALVALRPGAGAGELPVEWLAFGFPVAAVALAFLSAKAELALGNLRRFLSALERLDDAHLRLPSYNTEPSWSHTANRARRLQDYAAAVLVLAGNGIGLAALYYLYPVRVAAHAPVFGVAVLLAALSVLVLVLIPRASYSPVAD